MPEALAAVLIEASPEVFGATIIGSITVGSVVSYTAFLGAAFLATRLLQPGQPAQTTIATQYPIRQPIPARFRSYGRVKVAGVLGFEGVHNNASLYVLQMLGSGEIDAFEEHWLGDDQILFSHVTGLGATTYGGSSDGGGGFGTPEHDYPAAGCAFDASVGTADQSIDPGQLQTNFPGDWTPDCRWRGVPVMICSFSKPPNQEAAAQLYPFGPPNYRGVLRSAKIYDPRAIGQTADGNPDRPGDSGWTFSQNAALVILDFLRHPDGWARSTIGSGDRSMAPIGLFNVASFVAFAGICDQQVALKAGAGATVPRYLLAGSYDMGNTAPKTVLEGMLASCDGEIYRDGQGLIAIRGGVWGPDPVVTLDEDDIIEHELRPGASVFSAVNWMNAKFTWARADYNPADMDPWIDQDNIDQRGEVLQENLDLSWCPTHSQARRVAKITIGKRNPQWAGTVVTGPRGLLAYGERFIALDIPELGIDSSLSFLVTAFEASPTLERIKLTVASLDPAVYDWDAENEEGLQPVTGSAMPNQDIPAIVPGPTQPGAGTTFVVDVAFDRSTGTAIVTWANISFITLFYEAQYTSDGIDWINVPVPDVAGASLLSVTIEGLNGAIDYEFQVRSVTPAGKASSWSPGVGISAFNPTDKSADIALLNIGYTATRSANTGSVDPQVRSASSHSSGKFYLEFTINSAETTEVIAFGLASASHLFDTVGLGKDADSVGIWPKQGPSATNAYLNNVATGVGVLGCNANDVFGLAVDFGAGKLWVMNITQSSGWNGDVIAHQDPASSTGGFNIGALTGALFFCADVETIGQSVTVNTTVPYVGTPPTGFSDW